MASILERLRKHAERKRRREEAAREPAAVAGKETFALECPEVSRLEHFVGEKLKGRKLLEVRAHLVHCGDCVKQVEVIRKRRNA